MKKNIMKTLCLFLAITILTLTLYSCKGSEVVSNGGNSSDVTTVNPSEEDKTVKSIDEPKNETESKELQKHTVEYTVFYYDVIEDKNKSATKTIDISEKTLPPSYIFESISELSGETVGYHSVKIDKDKIFVDFDKSKTPFSGTGSSSEAGLLNGISKSLLFNFKEINEVYFTADGEEYSSGHYLQPKDEPYLTRENFEGSKNAEKAKN